MPGIYARIGIATEAYYIKHESPVHRTGLVNPNPLKRGNEKA